MRGDQRGVGKKGEGGGEKRKGDERRGEEGGVGKKGEGGGEEMDRGGRWHRYGRKEGEWEGKRKEIRREDGILEGMRSGAERRRKER